MNGGNLQDDLSKTMKGHFTRILCADCLWMDGQHQKLALSMRYFLSRDPHARIWVMAGFHTGRAKLVSFFDEAHSIGLETEHIFECNVDLDARQWVDKRNGGREDIGERSRWMVIAILKSVCPPRLGVSPSRARETMKFMDFGWSHYLPNHDVLGSVSTMPGLALQKPESLI